MSKNKSNHGNLDPGLLPESVGYELRRAQIRVFQNFDSALAGHNLTPGYFGILILLFRNPGISQSALAKAMGVERSTLGEVIGKLEARGLVDRKPSPGDRRSLAVRLSSKGEGFLEQVMPIVRSHEDKIAASLSVSERATLLDLLGRLAPDNRE
jgi:DNA-binding MarR family transcriptional regulator